MAGYDFEFYETGRISVTAGLKAFTGSGTAWKIRGCEGALVIVSGAGAVNFVSSLTTDAAGEFRTAWTGPTLANAQYTMWLPSSVAATALANHQRLAEIIATIDKAQPVSANLTALAALTSAADKGIMFTGAGAAGTFDLAQRGRDLLSGVSTTGLAVAVAANAAAARTVIGAQSELGYAPVSRAGDAGLTGNYTIISPDQYSRFLRFGIFGSVTDYRIEISGEYTATPLNTMNAYMRVKGLVGDAYFRFNSSGSLAVPGALSKGSGTFLIDHPLDPFNKNLRHGFVESTEYVNMYRGMVDLINGRMTVDINAAFGMTNGTFEALNADVMVSSLQNQYGPDRVWVEGPADSGKFTILCEDTESTATIAWMVTGRRNDAFVRSDLDPNTDSEGRFIPEFDKEDA